MIAIQIILCYVFLIPVFYFILLEKVKLLNTMIVSCTPRKRGSLAKALEEAKKDTVLSLLWPLLLIREARDAIKNKK